MKGFLEELNRWNKETQEARAEAIKEFAERVRHIIEKHYLIRGLDCVIDNLVEEMEGKHEIS